MKTNVRKLTLSAILCAMAYLVMAVGRIPITSVDFLKFDPKDTVLAIGAFILGPMQGMLMSIVVSVIEMVTVSSTGIIGCFMNILSTCAFICPAAWMYRRRRTLSGAVCGLTVGVLLMTALMLLWNYFITPYYMGYPREAIAEMLAPVFLPFNLVKGALNAALTMLLYQPLKNMLRSARFLEPAPASDSRGRIMPGVIIVSVVVLASCVMAILVMRGII